MSWSNALLLSIKESWNLRKATVLRHRSCLHFTPIIYKIRRKSILFNFKSFRELQLVKKKKQKTSLWKQEHVLKGCLNSAILQVVGTIQLLFRNRVVSIASSKTWMAIYFISLSNGLYLRDARPPRTLRFLRVVILWSSLWVVITDTRESWGSMVTFLITYRSM